MSGDVDALPVEEQLYLARFLKVSQKIFQRNQPCVINTDIDGILTGTILQNYLGWNVVGFCDSKDTIFVDETYRNRLHEIIFVDIFIHNPDITCVDQHIVSPDKQFSQELFSSNKKLNPNIQRIRYASPNKKDSQSYAWKYPFGSVHFIIAILEYRGYVLDLDIKELEGLSTYDLLLRADDSARTTAYRYKENASDWWRWLNLFGGALTEELSLKAKTSTIEHADNMYSVFNTLFRKFGCHTADGNFSKELKNNNGVVSERVNSFFEYVAHMLGLPKIELPEKFVIRQGTFLLEATYNHESVQDILKKKDLFSYAYTYCMGVLAAKGFSYTLMNIDQSNERIE